MRDAFGRKQGSLSPLVDEAMPASVNIAGYDLAPLSHMGSSGRLLRLEEGGFHDCTEGYTDLS